MTKFTFHSALLFGSLTMSAATADPAMWTTGPFDMPESALFDQEHNRIIVSVIGGHPGQADGNGGLALVSPDGAMLNPAWITGLDAPKGMAIVGDTLLVADLTRLHEIDLNAGTLTRSFDVTGAVFLNDITSRDDAAFVSDFMAHRIWRYSDGEVHMWLDTPALAHPNGLLLDQDRLLVASWGDGMRDDFTTETPGSLLSVSLDTKHITTVAPDLGNLDGIARIGGQIVVNDWVTGALFTMNAKGDVTQMGQFAPGLADIAAHGDTLFLPSMLEGTLTAQRVPVVTE